MRVVILIAFALAGCTNTKDPVLVSEVCTRGHTNMVLMPISRVQCAKTCRSYVTMHLMPVYRCDHYMHIVRPNPNYIATTDKED